jgi:hypothetical protein
VDNFALLYVNDVRDRFSGLVVRVPDCRPKGPGFDPQRYHIVFVAVGPERGPFNLVKINEELLERKVAPRV